LVKLKLNKCDDYDGLIQSPAKHYKTNLSNYWCCPAQRQYQLNFSNGR